MTILYVSVDILASHAVCIEVPPERTVRDDFSVLLQTRGSKHEHGYTTCFKESNLTFTCVLFFHRNGQI